MNLKKFQFTEMLFLFKLTLQKLYQNSKMRPKNGLINTEKF